MVLKWKVTERDAQPIAKVLVHLLENWMKHAARRALIITKLFHVHRSVWWTKRVRRLGARNAPEGDVLCRSG